MDPGLTGNRALVNGWRLRRLGAADAVAYQAFRLDGVVRHPHQFRIAAEDERALPTEAVAARLTAGYVVGAFDAEGLTGIGGLTRYDGAKLRHKALLWGMYVHERARGRGLAGELVEALLAEARREGVAHVLLTVAADNAPARRLYERSGFRTYGVEPGSVRVDGLDLDEALMVYVCGARESAGD